MTQWPLSFYIVQIINGSKVLIYSHLSNNRGGWNKRGGSAKLAKSINVEVGINMAGEIVLKKLVHKCNKRGVESVITL